MIFNFDILSGERLYERDENSERARQSLMTERSIEYQSNEVESMSCLRIKRKRILFSFQIFPVTQIFFNNSK